MEFVDRVDFNERRLALASSVSLGLRAAALERGAADVCCRAIILSMDLMSRTTAFAMN